MGVVLHRRNEQRAETVFGREPFAEDRADDGDRCGRSDRVEKRRDCAGHRQLPERRSARRTEDGKQIAVFGARQSERGFGAHEHDEPGCERRHDDRRCIARNR